ncbi:MAG: hypothetical protein JWO89_1375, partial [Verrucomicrobiaceae bacterium]|nr:hypothetical protein [Verrucomicrobiaceae bacterium]
KLLAVGDNGSVNVSDALPTLNMTVSSQTASEGAGTVQVQVNLGFPAASDLSVPFTLGGTATAGVGNDYTAAASPIVIPAGQTSGFIAITLTNDGNVETDETVTLTLGANANAHLGTRSSTVLTIADDDGPPPLNFTRSMALAQEHAGTVGVQVELGWPAPPGGVSVPIIKSGSTGAGDFSGVPSSLNFAQGEMSKFISIAITDDTDVESNETVTLTLDAPTGAVLGTSTVFTLTIEDNDPNSEPGKRWALRHPRPSAEFLTSIATNGNRQVIVGGSGGVLTSDDAGLTWVPRYTGSNAFYTRVVPVGATGFLAVGDYGHVATSPDGIVWSDVILPGTARSSFLGAASNGLQTVIVGYDYGSYPSFPFIFSSSDLVHWTRSTVPAVTGGAQAVVWNGSKFVVVGGSFDIHGNEEQAIVMTSTDGVVWALGTPPAAAKMLENLIWAGDKFIAFNYTNKAYTSPDGVTWTERSLGTKGIINGVSVTGTQVLAVGLGGVIANSTNGTTWTQRASGVTTLDLEGVVKTATNYIAIGGFHSIFTSPDGVVWTARSTGADLWGSLASVVWSGTKFVAVGGDYYDNTVPMLSFTSPDGTHWTKSSTPVKAAPLAVAWSGSLFAGVGTRGSIVTSTDGLTWVSRVSGTTLTLRDVIWSGSQFVAVGGNETNEDYQQQASGSIVLTSPNGITWTRRTIPTIHALEGIAFNGSLYVAVGRSSYDGGNTEAVVLTSPDAVNWIGHNSDVMQKDLGHIIWNGSLFVATRENFGIMHSADGINWTPATQMPQLPPEADGLELHDLCWTGSKFVVAVDGGLILTSTDADEWTLQQTDAHNLKLYGVAWNGSTLVAVGENAVIETSSTGVTPPAPSVQFAARSSAISESGGTASILVTLSAPPTAKVTVPFSVAGGTGVVLAGALADVTLPASPLTFNPGEITKFINVVIKPDGRNEGDEKLTFTLGPNIIAATGGSQLTHELTINNEDIVPSATLAGGTSSKLVEVGKPISLTVNATGTPPLTYVWKKNNVVVGGANTSTLFVPAAALTNAGGYTCTVNNPTGMPFTTSVIEIGVYEKTSRHIAGLATRDAVLTQAAAGNGLTFAWYKDGSMAEVAASATTVYDATKKTLTLKQPLGAGALGIYQCQILQTASSDLKNGNVYSVATATAKPTLGPISLPSGQVGVFYSQAISTVMGSAPVATWSAVGLPSGLTIDPDSGNIRGYPTLAIANKPVTITATNGAGSTSSVGVKITITALPPGIAGIWNGLISRDEAVNRSLGSRLEITVTAMGTYTGKIITGTTPVSISGQVKVTGGTSATAKTPLVLNGNTLAELEFDFDTTDSPPALSGEITATPPGGEDSTTLSLVAWRAFTPATNYVGKHNFALDLNETWVNDPNFPQGTGFGTATVTATGAVTTAGKVSDGSLAYTSSSFIGTGGECLLYGSLYGGKGTITGIPVIYAASGATGGNLPPQYSISDASGTHTTWNKLPDTTAIGARTYAAGWEPITLRLRGQRYIAPAATAVVMGMVYSPGVDNASLIFSKAGLPSDIEMDVGVKVGGVIAPIIPSANPYRITLTITPSSGAFKGTLNLTKTVNGVVIKRDPIAYEGLIIPNRYTASSRPDEGVGYFMLPQLPDAGISPLPPAASTPIFSGRVVLSPMGIEF